MKLPFSLRTSRRGFTLPEVAVSTTLTLVVMTAVLSLVITAGRIDRGIALRTASDQSATLAMNRMGLDVRGAKELQVLNPCQFRVYYPVTLPNGQYDRSRVDPNNYVEYAQGDSKGKVAEDGSYIWRRTATGAAEQVTRDVKLLRARADTPTSLRLSVEVVKTAGVSSASTHLDERVLYLRNH